MASEDELQEAAICLAGRALFYYACEAGNLEGLKIFLIKRPYLNISALHEWTMTEWKTPLQPAVSAGHFQVVAFLLSLRVDLETRCNPWEPYTALHFAAESSSPEMVRLLLDDGADTHAAFGSFDGDTGPAAFLSLRYTHPLGGILAVEQKHYDTIDIFLELGHDINTPGSTCGQGSLVIKSMYWPTGKDKLR